MKLFKTLTAVCMCIFGALQLSAQTYTFSGTVQDKNTGDPIEFATVILQESGQWAVADAKGVFSVRNVPAGKTTVKVECLGYAAFTKEVTISKNEAGVKIQLSPDNLALEGAVVTAQEDQNAATTARTIDKTALDHVQILNMGSIGALLPGGGTSSPNLTGSQTISIRSNGVEAGNASFGTAVEVDGVRLSNNASFSGSSGKIAGVTTNNIASSNVESVEVISGVASVEYGDMTSGVVRINTRKGKTPWVVTMSTNPNNKQLSLSKGFGLGNTSKGASRGVLNASAEYTKSVSDLMSPFTSYDRKQLSLIYSNTLSRGAFANTPLRFTAGLTGNLGGYDSKNDPDLFRDEWYRSNDNVIRGNVGFDWLLSKPWITNIELKAAASYQNKQSKERDFYQTGIPQPSLHGTQEGYFIAGQGDEIVLVPGSPLFNVIGLDDRPLNAKITLKANWAKNFGEISSKFKIGADYSLDKNFGIGQYTEDMATAPTFREYRYCDVPAMSNAGVYAEETMTIPTGKTGRLLLVAGVRNDNTIVPGSEYGVTSSISPRFNAKYTVFDTKGRQDKLIRELSFRASWGESVKQPSFAVLYPEPTYHDILTFQSTAAADNKSYRAYYILPRRTLYNPDLVWQRSRQTEFGTDINIAGTRINLAAYYSKVLDSYYMAEGFDEFSYTLSKPASINGIDIPADSRIYSVDRNTGVITVSDKDGAHASREVGFEEYKRYTTNSMSKNRENPITRYGLEWVVDFPRIKAINTTFRVDGSYYYYKNINSEMEPYANIYNQRADGSAYPYTAYFYGGHTEINGNVNKTLTTNLTITTHIPRVRMILSAKVEACLLRYSRSCSEKADGSARVYALNGTNRSAIFDIDENASIYNGDKYTVLYPDYYVKYGETEKRDYMSDLLRAKENDPSLYADLAAYTLVSQYDYTFNDNSVTPYYNVNFSVTKEIGDLASLSFYANNFFNNMSQVYSTRTKTYSSASGYIANYYFGLTLRLKF